MERAPSQDVPLSPPSKWGALKADRPIPQEEDDKELKAQKKPTWASLDQWGSSSDDSRQLPRGIPQVQPRSTLVLFALANAALGLLLVASILLTLSSSPSSPHSSSASLLWLYRGASEEASPGLSPDCKHADVAASLGNGNSSRQPWAGFPAQCNVRGLVIEALTPQVNFRPRYTTGFTSDVQDKAHLVPWLLAARKDFTHSRRRILLDFGGLEFSTSVRWFMTSYPLHFDEIHAFEMNKGVFQVPPPGEFPPEDLARVQVHDGVVVGDISPEAEEQSRGQPQLQINATRWIIEELRAAPEDAVIVKMDIETSEWPLLQHWARSEVMGSLVDELFVEMHYGHESMKRFDKIWNPEYNNHTRDDATLLLHQLRANGIYAHAWP